MTKIIQGIPLKKCCCCLLLMVSVYSINKILEDLVFHILRGSCLSAPDSDVTQPISLGVLNELNSTN